MPLSILGSGIGGVSDVYKISSSEPENKKLLWIDTNNNNAVRFYDKDSNSWKFIPGVYGGQ